MIAWPPPVMHLMNAEGDPACGQYQRAVNEPGAPPDFRGDGCTGRWQWVDCLDCLRTKDIRIVTGEAARRRYRGRR